MDSDSKRETIHQLANLLFFDLPVRQTANTTYHLQHELTEGALEVICIPGRWEILFPFIIRIDDKNRIATLLAIGQEVLKSGVDEAITNKDKLCEERATIYPFVGRARGLYGERGVVREAV
uniref:Uncharacterized protein n=2 Tax=Candidatus Kentrum sp. MB TaxID=2138164 RepID=A0A450Y1U1_9GAMM|nr:MAG: hypothetical protein BECKMB1821I_GA0114274_11231 [Candidatus Kentron sp. MB]